MRGRTLLVSLGVAAAAVILSLVLAAAPGRSDDDRRADTPAAGSSDPTPFPSPSVSPASVSRAATATPAAASPGVALTATPTPPPPAAASPAPTPSPTPVATPSPAARRDPAPTEPAPTVPPPTDSSPADPVPTDPGAPELDALREMGRGAPGPDDDAVTFGAGVRRRGRTPRPASGAPTPTPASTPEADALPFVGGQARGFVMLPLMLPAARASSEALVDTMVRARLRENYLSVLTDGTFGFDEAAVVRAARRLTAEGRRLDLTLYLTNGPTQRDYRTTLVSAGFARTEPLSFRQEIRWEPRVRNEFGRLAARAAGLADAVRAAAPAVTIRVSVMLEDNFDAPAYRAARDLAAPYFGPGVTWVRSPCEGCTPGADDDPAGDRAEFHLPEDFDRLRPGDGFTLDGTGYTYGRPDRLARLSPENVRALLDRGLARGLAYFGLWRPRLQGIYVDTSARPEERVYEVPSEEDVRRDVALLRHGLTPDEPADTYEGGTP